jgi:hypothetical protein
MQSNSNPLENISLLFKGLFLFLHRKKLNAYIWIKALAPIVVEILYGNPARFSIKIVTIAGIASEK